LIAARTAELQESETRYRSLYHTVADGIFVMGPDGRIEDNNDSACRQLGYAREELIGLPVSAVSARSDFQPGELFDRLRTAGSLSYETTHLRKDGVCIPVELSVVRIDYRGRPAILGVARDITERKRAEEGLREKEHLLSESQRIGHIGTWSVDLATKAATWTRETYRLFGVCPETFVPSAEALIGLLHPDDRELMREWIRAAGAGVPPEALEIRVPLADGSIRVLSGRGEMVYADGDRPVRLVGTVQDITEQKQARAALLESEERYRILLEHGFDGIFVHDDFRIVQLNDHLAEMTGYTRSELLGSAAGDLFTPASQERIRRYTAEEKGGCYEIELRHRDERIVDVESYGAPCRFQGREARIVGIRDITERKQAREAMRRLNEDLERQVAQRTEELRHTVDRLRQLTLELSQAEDRERKRIAGILHEDVQQMLAAARFHLNLLTSEPRSAPESRELIEQVKRMLRDAIERSRGLSHELSPAIYHVELSEILEWLARHMQQKHGLTVCVKIHGHLDSSSEALKAFLYKVAQELLFNVVKHAGVGEAEVRARRMGRSICLSVLDRGRGFDPRELEQTTGFGLLSVCERVRLLGGRMTIRSRPGGGSRIVVAVPDPGVSGSVTPIL
jgi:PAS domain S-box-containing protein